MDITPLVGAGRQIIQSYSGGKFRVTGVVHDGPVIVLPEATQAWAAARPLSVDSFAPLLALAGELDVVLFGAGAAVDAADLKLRKALKASGLAIDIMDTGAACRTYNVLMAEGRRVAVALLPV